MAYFPNGSSGDRYQDTYCVRCAHVDGKDGMGCPVWNLHLDAEFLKVSRMALDTLIPMGSSKVYADECAMFIEAPPKPTTVDERFPETVHPAYRTPSNPPPRAGTEATS